MDRTQMERKNDESLTLWIEYGLALLGGVRTIIMDKLIRTRYLHDASRSGLDSIKGTLSVYCNYHNTRRGKLDNISMDFITKLPRSKSGHDTIWVIVDRLTNSAYFLATREDYSMDKLARLYIDEIVARHGVPVSIISYRDGRKNRTKMSVKQFRIEDMLRAFYHIQYSKVLRFEALYGRKCRSPVLWDEIGESRLIGLELVQETTNKVVLIKEKLKAARDRQKSYADNRAKATGV
ncbi:putative reverse transcriptase domain-containing protein [Tanacetum coccineum]|uniref:Reverse transcriptase domain-containing protein n=1 Tax=Tanacetum coccineum TaxID=301880 RepID=A0ABQ5EWP1_9ASTR